MAVQHTMYSGDPNMVRRTLKPGETTVLESVSLGIGSASADRKPGGPLVAVCSMGRRERILSRTVCASPT